MKSSCNTVFLSFGVNKWVLPAEEKCCMNFTEEKPLKNIWPSKPVYEACFLQEKNPQGHNLLISKFVFVFKIRGLFFFIECYLINLAVWKEVNFRYDWFCGKLCFPQQLCGSFISESCLSGASATILNYRNCAVNNFTTRYWSWNGLSFIRILLCRLLLLHWFNLQRNIAMKI